MGRTIITDVENTEEKKVEKKDTADTGSNIRPVLLKDYIGQKKIKENILISITAAKNRGESLEHILFYGPPGLGKTTIAHVVANEMGSRLRETSGPAIEHPGEIAAILSNLNDGDVLFIDEIHRLPKPVEEVLYSAMEDFAVDITVGKGVELKSVRLELPKFTLIGATTRAGMLSAPLRDRFGMIYRMEYYEPSDLKKIVKRTANILNFKIDDKSARTIAECSRGTPRIANRITKRVRDYVQVVYNGEVHNDSVKNILDILEIKHNGLNASDINLINLIHSRFNNGPVGLELLASAMGEDSNTIEDVNEPFLIKEGIINKTPRGRVLTEKGKKIAMEMKGV